MKNAGMKNVFESASHWRTGPRGTKHYLRLRRQPLVDGVEAAVCDEAPNRRVAEYLHLLHPPPSPPTLSRNPSGSASSTDTAPSGVGTATKNGLPVISNPSTISWNCFWEERWEKWLSKFERGSVIYCTFGSQIFLPNWIWEKERDERRIDREGEDWKLKIVYLNFEFNLEWLEVK